VAYILHVRDLKGPEYVGDLQAQLFHVDKYRIRRERPSRAVEVRTKDKEIKSLKVREMIPSSSRPVEG